MKSNHQHEPADENAELQLFDNGNFHYVELLYTKLPLDFHQVSTILSVLL